MKTNPIDRIIDLDELISLLDKKLTLLKELRESLLFETAEYVCDRIETPGHSQSWYILVHRTSKFITKEGPLKDIEKYLDRHLITSVYWRK